MTSCDQEMCPFWTGDGCACALLDIDEDERREQRRQIGIYDPEDDEL